MMADRFSIITPSLNQGPFLENCIQSVIDQKEVNLEHVVVDGGSTDESVAILKKYNEVLEYWHHKPDQGQTDAINQGFQHISGDFVNWLNADDFLVQGALKCVRKAFKNYDADVVCGFSKLNWPNDISRVKRSSRFEGRTAEFIAWGQIMQPSTFWRREVISEFMPLPANLRFLMDHFLWLQYIAKYGWERIVYIDHEICGVTMHADAKSVKLLDQFDLEREKLFADLLDSFLGRADQSLNFGRFIANHEPIRRELGDIQFLLTYDRIFKRNQFGNKVGLRPWVLKKSLAKYPLKTLKLGLKKLAL